MKEALERIGTALVWALAGMGMVTAISGYLLPAEAHVAMAKPFYGAYADKQFPVLDSHYAVSFFHRFGGFLLANLLAVPLAETGASSASETFEFCLGGAARGHGGIKAIPAL